MTDLIFVDLVDTQLGWVVVAGTDGVVERILIGHPTEQAALRAIRGSFGASRELEVGAWHPELSAAIRAYAEGEAVDFSHVQLDLAHLTPFGRRVIAHCRKVGFGRTATYRDLAQRAGSPGAARAVGNVMAANRYPLVVPCHRVVASGGGLGGFSAPQGTDLKRRLLDMESQHLAGWDSTPAELACASP